LAPPTYLGSIKKLKVALNDCVRISFAFLTFVWSVVTQKSVAHHFVIGVLSEAESIIRI